MPQCVYVLRVGFLQGAHGTGSQSRVIFELDVNIVWATVVVYFPHCAHDVAFPAALERIEFE